MKSKRSIGQGDQIIRGRRRRRMSGRRRGEGRRKRKSTRRKRRKRGRQVVRNAIGARKLNQTSGVCCNFRAA
jgi:hypothetical protein